MSNEDPGPVLIRLFGLYCSEGVPLPANEQKQSRREFPWIFLKIMKIIIQILIIS